MQSEQLTDETESCVLILRALGAGTRITLHGGDGVQYGAGPGKGEQGDSGSRPATARHQTPQHVRRDHNAQASQDVGGAVQPRERLTGVLQLTDETARGR